MNHQTITTYHDADRYWTLHEGDVQQVLPILSPNSFSGVFCDSPYGLSFMENDWDQAVPSVSVWEQVLRLCKPGAYLLAFGGTRTFHRMVCNIEEAGWEIRNTLYWLYGEGFPKGQNISKGIAKQKGVVHSTHDSSGTPKPEEAKLWEGYNTALKPACEPIVLAQKPRRGTFAANALRFGCGGLNIDGCRIGATGGTRRSHQEPYPKRNDGREDRTQWARTGHSVEPINGGRWPSNVVLDEHVAGLVDAQSGVSRSRRSRRRKTGSNVGNGNTLHSFLSRHDCVEGYSDHGGASRFFYVAKAKGEERGGNDHPTLKPLTLCEYLARLILPPQGHSLRRLLVPFSGVASEMIGGLSAGWDHTTGIERESDYVDAARCRLTQHTSRISVALVPDTPSVTCHEPIILNTVTQGDCRDLIPRLPDDSVDAVVTSPPYADQRKKHYPGVPAEEYADFTVGWMARLAPKLKKDGSVLIVIRPDLKKGVINDYVLRTRLALREAGWNECEELIWLKRDGGACMGSKYRPRRCYEQILWFSKTHNPFVDMKACGHWAEDLSFRATSSGRHWKNKRGAGQTKLTDVIDVPVRRNPKGVSHPAMFPVELAEKLIKSFCPEHGVVLDPFAGSGNTCLAAHNCGRSYYGLEIMDQYCTLARERLEAPGRACSKAS